MDKIDAVLATRIITRPSADDANELETIEVTSTLALCCQAAKTTLNRYYALTDNSHLYRIAMSKFFPHNNLVVVNVVAWATSLAPQTQNGVFQGAAMAAILDRQRLYIVQGRIH